MKSKRILYLAVLLCAMCLLVCGCNGSVNSVVNAQKHAIKNATSFSCTATVTDCGVVVYVYQKAVSFSDGMALVTTSEKTLNSSFVLEEKSSFEEVQEDRNSISTINLSAKGVSQISQKDGVSVLTVHKDFIASILGVDIEASEDGEIIVETIDGNLVNLTVNFKSVSGRCVTLTYNYNY